MEYHSKTYTTIPVRALLTLLLLANSLWANAQEKDVLRLHFGDAVETFRIASIDSITAASLSIGIPDSMVAVDLGLSVKWASCNLGATQPYRYGGYFAWGETKEKANYTWKSYLDGTMQSQNDCGTASDPLQGNSDIASSRHDAATQQWSNAWRMPTYAEIKELVEKCKWTWTVVNGVSGYYVTGMTGKSIFLPMSGLRTSQVKESSGLCGIYASSTKVAEYSDLVYGLYFDANNVCWTMGGRCYGRSIRPVTSY